MSLSSDWVQSFGKYIVSVTECDVPASSSLDRRMLDAAYFSDSYRAPLRKGQASMADIFFGLFGHSPVWIKTLLLIRNRIACGFGLDVPKSSDILQPIQQARYQVRDTIGPWPIFLLTDNELIAERDNKHLDFRLSLLRELHDGEPSVVVSTICNVHNVLGKIYLFFIVPFHKWGVKTLIGAAVIAGRL
jgi:hypothetical protein